MARHPLNWFPFIAASCLGPLTMAEAQTISAQNLSPKRGAIGEEFGASVSMWDDLLVVGAPGRHHMGGGTRGGAAVVYRWSAGAWQLEDELRPFIYASQDDFGFAVSAWGDRIAVSSPGANGRFVDAGAVVVFEHRGTPPSWVEEDRFFATDGRSTYGFGEALAMYDDVVVVGSPKHDARGLFSGSVYIYRYDPAQQAWTNEIKLLPVDSRAGQEFGASVALWDNVLVVGAPGDDSLALRSGAVYVYRYDPVVRSWIPEQKLLGPPVVSLHRRFGHSVSVSFDALLVGVPGERRGGAAYVYRHDSLSQTWTAEDPLKPVDKVVGDEFGQAVQVSGTTAIVSAINDDDRGQTDIGAAYVFQHQLSGSWREEAKLALPKPRANDRFGHAVAHWGDRFVVGNPRLALHGTAATFDNEFFRLRVGSVPLPVGQPVLFTLLHGTPNAKAVLFWSSKAFGSTWVQSLGVELELRQPQPVGAPLTTDANGRADWLLTLPAKASGLQARFQAAQAGRRTPPQAVPIQ